MQIGVRHHVVAFSGSGPNDTRVLMNAPPFYRYYHLPYEDVRPGDTVVATLARLSQALGVVQVVAGCGSTAGWMNNPHAPGNHVLHFADAVEVVGTPAHTEWVTVQALPVMDETDLPLIEWSLAVHLGAELQPFELEYWRVGTQAERQAFDLEMRKAAALGGGLTVQDLVALNAAGYRALKPAFFHQFNIRRLLAGQSQFVVPE